jgi:hypothetical protein
LNHIEFSTIPLLDSVLKSLVNQCSLLPVLAALFLTAASAFLQGMPLSELSDMQARQINQLEARLSERPVCRCWWCRMMRTIGGLCK